MNIEIDQTVHVELLQKQRDALLQEIVVLRRSIADLEIIVASLAGDADAES